MNVIFIRPTLVVMNLVLICVTIIAFSDKSEDANETTDYEPISQREFISTAMDTTIDNDSKDLIDSTSPIHSRPNIILINANLPFSKEANTNNDLSSSNRDTAEDSLNNHRLQLALQEIINLNRDSNSKVRIPHSQKIYLQYYKEDQESRKEYLKLQEAYAISDKILEEKKLRMVHLKEKYKKEFDSALLPKEKALRIKNIQK